MTAPGPPREVPFPSLQPPPCLLRQGTNFQGHLVLRGPVRIDGRIEGQITASGLLWIGASARVRARVEADEVVIAGLVEGEVRACTRIELQASARVRGELRAPRFMAADGAFLEGSCHAGPPEEGDAPPSPRGLPSP